MRGWLSSVDLDDDDQTPVEQAADHAREVATRPTADQLERARAEAERTGEPLEAVLVRLQQAHDPLLTFRAALRYFARSMDRAVVPAYRSAAQQAQILAHHAAPVPPGSIILNQHGYPGGPSVSVRGYAAMEPRHVEPLTAVDLMALAAEDDEQPPPQPSRSDLRARQRAADRAHEARMRHQQAHPPPRARRRH